MMNRIRIAALATVLVLVLGALAPAAALAAGGLPDEIVVGDDFTLAEGETLQGNLVIYGGNAELEEGSRVTGDVVLVGGSLDASGEIGGDVVLVGGDAHIRETAVITGDLVTVGGELTREAGAQVLGQEVSSVGGSWFPGDFAFRVPFSHWVQLGQFGLAQVIQAIGWALTMGVLALVVLALWPDQTARVSQAVLAAPAPALGMGLLTAIAGAVVFSLLILALCLGLVGWLALVASVLFGWVALGSIVGARLAPALKLGEVSPTVTGALGTFALTLTVEILRLVPCLGVLFAIGVASLGLGAVVLTRFGTQPYVYRPTPPQPPAPVTPPPQPPAPVETY
jgi:hypothetical protein